MEDALTLILYLVIAAIVGIVALIRKVMEKAGTGEDGKKVNLAEAVQAEINRYLKGGPPGRFGGRGWGEPEEAERETAPSASQTPPALLTREAPPRQAPPRPPLKPAGQRHRVDPGPSREPVPLRVKPGIDKRRSLVEQATGAERVLRSGSRRAGYRFALTRKNLRKAVLLAEVLGPPVGERRDYRLF